MFSLLFTLYPAATTQGKYIYITLYSYYIRETTMFYTKLLGLMFYKVLYKKPNTSIMVNNS